MPTNLMWINEVNYITGTDQEFVEIATPVDDGFRPGFTVVIYAPDGTVLSSSAPVAASTTAPDGINHISVGGQTLPDSGFGVALVDDNGSVREFLSFGLGTTTIRATEGAADGETSDAIDFADTESRSVHINGFAAGPTGWQWKLSRVGDQTEGAVNNGQRLFLSKTSEDTDKAVGTAGGETIDGKGGNDFLFGLAGNDTLNGGADNDVLSGGSGADSLDGGDGTDTASYLDDDAGVTIGGTGGTGGSASGDTYASIERFRLTDFADTFDFTGVATGVAVNSEAGADDVTGSDGDDTIDARQGDDTIDGGAGNDRILPRQGVDEVAGGAGDDRIVLDSDGDADTIFYDDADEGSDLIFGYEVGVDVIDLSDGDITVTAIDDSGVDTVLTLDNGTVITVAGVDFDDITFNGGTFPPPGPVISGEEVIGDDGLDDRLKGTSRDDLIDGLGGNDRMFARAGADTVFGGDGDDRIILNTDGDVDTIVFTNRDEGEDLVWRYEVGVDEIELRDGVQVQSWADSGNRVTVTLDSGTVISFVGTRGLDFDDITFVDSGPLLLSAPPLDEIA